MKVSDRIQILNLFFFLILLVALSVFMAGCAHKKAHKFHDPQLEYQKKDYDTLTSFPKHSPLKKRKKVKKASFLNRQVLPESLRKPVSLVVTENVPMSEILLTLAQEIDINLILDPRIKDGTTLIAKNRRFIDIVNELCHAHGLRYRYSNQILHIERDDPFVKTYNLQFLVMARTNRNRLSIATDVFTNVDNGQRLDEDNGSNTFLTAETKSDFWQELADNLTPLLEDFETGNEGTPKFSIHKQAGIISIKTTQKKHDQIAKYLDLLQESVGRQVLIEAKIIEVNLKDQFKTGINWNLLRGTFALQAPLGEVAGVGQLEEAVAPPRDVFSIGGNAEKITGLLSVLNQFGTVRALSNPRLTVMNNNPAVLKVARNKVYFKLNQTRDFLHHGDLNRERERSYFSSDIKTVPIGLMMYVHPTIDRTGRIIMTLRPTISQVIQEVPDPAVAIASQAAQRSLVPEVQVRELDTILSMQSGEIVVVGGLMEERSANQQDGVPTAEDVPLLGGLFKGKSHDRSVTELVIFIRATVVENDFETEVLEDTIDAADKNLYENHITDPRPL